MTWNNIHIDQPVFLILLLLLPLLAWWQHRRRSKDTVYMLLPFDIVPAKISGLKKVAIASLSALKIIFFLAAIIALIRPQKVLQEEEVRAEGIDIVLAMDISSSMLSRDFDPDRLTVSKLMATEFVDKRPYDRIGLVVFAAESYTQSPLTTDHRILKEYIGGLQCGYLENGTAIGMGLAAAVNRLKDSDTRSKVVILLTDGVNNAGYIEPSTAMELAIEFGIKVYTIGIGTEGRALTPTGRNSAGEYSFSMRRVEIDEVLLREIGRSTGGAYFRATSEETLKRIYDEIDQLEKTELDITVFRRFKDLFRPFVWIGLGALTLFVLIKFVYLKMWP